MAVTEADVASVTPPLEPVRSKDRVQFLDDEQLDRLGDATLRILEDVGVRFPSDRALDILDGHGATVDRETRIVRFPPDLVRRALASAPRRFTMAARDPRFDLHLQDGVTHLTTDGCGVTTIDFGTGLERPSRKSDIAEMARIAGSLPSIGFILPTVRARGRRPAGHRGRRPARRGRHAGGALTAPDGRSDRARAGDHRGSRLGCRGLVMTRPTTNPPGGS